MKTRVALIALTGLGLLAFASAAATYDMTNNPDFNYQTATPYAAGPTCPSPAPSPCQACKDKVYDGPHTEWPGAPECTTKPVIPVPVANVNPCQPEQDSPQCLPTQHDPSDDYALVVGPCANAQAPSYSTPSYTPTYASPAYKAPTCGTPAPTYTPPSCSQAAPTYAPPTCGTPGYSQPPSYQTASCGVTVAPCKLPEAPVDGCGPDGFFPDHASLEDMKVRAQLCRSKAAFDYKNWAFYKGYKKICCSYCSITGSDEPICSADVGTGCNQVPRWACDDSTPEIVVIKPAAAAATKVYNWPVDKAPPAYKTPCQQAAAAKSSGYTPASGNGY